MVWKYAQKISGLKRDWERAKSLYDYFHICFWYLNFVLCNVYQG